jgi:hypothetical protein
VGFLEERLQPIVELHAVASDLVLPAHHGPPEPLLDLVHVNRRDVVRHRPLLVGAESVPRRIDQGRELLRAEHGNAQLFGQSRTLRVKQLLGLESSMANPDLTAPNAGILPNRRFSCPFAGLQAQLQPVAEIVQGGEPDPRQFP